MPETGFIAWRKWIQSIASEAGLTCSNRKASSLVPPVAAHFGVTDSGLTDSVPPYGDPTGEIAVASALRKMARAYA